MALSTYGNLKASVASWLKRADLTAQITDFIALAEARIRRDVRCRAMETEATGTLTTTTVAFPTRFIEARQVSLGGYLCEYVTPQQFYDSETNGYQYTIKGETFHFQSATETYDIEYYAAFAPFTDDGDTNWLLTNAPDIYLWGSLAEAYNFVQGDPAKWLAMYAKAVADLRASEQRAKHPGVMAVRPYGVYAA